VYQHKRRMTASVLVALALSAGLLSASPTRADTDPQDPAFEAEPTTFSASALPTVQTNGIVWDTVIDPSRDRVYAVGKFTQARPAISDPGSVTARVNVLAFSLSTGRLDPTFVPPPLDAQANVVALSTDGAKVYVGGDFTNVGGITRNRFVSLDAETGAVDLTLNLDLNSTVRAIATSDQTIYVGGAFSSAGGQARRKAAAFSTAGDLLPFSPRVGDGQVYSMIAQGSKVVMGGNFFDVEGSTMPGRGLAMVDATIGRNLPLPASAAVRNGGTQSAIWSLKAMPDGSGFYGTGFSYLDHQGSLEGSFRADWDGNLLWLEDCHGDTYDAQYVDGVMYTVSHKHDCSNLGTGGFPETSPMSYYRATATTSVATGTTKPDVSGYQDNGGTPSPSLLTFYPAFDTGTVTGASGQAGWTIEGTEDYLVIGGEFTKVNGKQQQTLVRFGRSVNDQGPVLPGAGMDFAATDAGDESVKLTWRDNWDPDNQTLTYRVSRYSADGSVPLPEVTSTSPFWNPSTHRVIDEGRTRGSQLTYTLYAEDRWGNKSSVATATVDWASEDPGDPGFDTFESGSTKPAIAGTASAGKTLTVQTRATWSPVGNPAHQPYEVPASTFQWLRDGVPIAGATSATYIVNRLDAGRHLTVRETVEDRSAYGSALSDPIIVSLGDLRANTPAIIGGSSVGSVLNSDVGAYPNGVTVRYQWLRDGHEIPGATGSSYRITADDAGRTISLVVGITRSGYAPGSAVSAGGPRVPAYNSARPALKGKLRVNKTLKVRSKGVWAAPGYTFTVRWKRNGKSIKGATKTSYKLKKADRKKRITVVVTARRAGFATVTVTSRKSSRVK